MQDINAVQSRLARYYLNRLRTADTVYRHGQMGSAESLALLGQDWAQIAQWQAWCAAHSAHSQEAAQLCAAYPQAGAEVLITRQTPQERIEWLARGLEAARALGDRRAEAVCLFRMAWAIHKQAALDEAEAVAHEALTRAEALGDPLLSGQCLHLLGEIMVRRADFAQAQPLFAHSRALLQRIAAQAALAEVYFSMSEVAYLRCEYASARDAALQCYRIYTALGLNPATTNNLTCLGIFTAEAGDLDAGEEYVRQSVALCRSSGAHSTLAHALKTLAGFMIVRKAWAQARMYADESREIAQTIGEAWLIPDILIFSARISSRTGDHVAALRDASLAVSIGRETGYRLTLLEALINLADVQRAANQTGQARAALREGLALAAQTKATIHLLYGLFVAVRLWHACGDAACAAEWAGLLLRHPGVEVAVRSQLPAFCAALEAQLGAECFATAVERGQTLALETVVPNIIAALAKQPGDCG